MTAPQPQHLPDDPFGPARRVTSYSELMAAMQAHIDRELGVRQLDFDRLAGFPPGLSGKVFGMLEVKRLGVAKLFDALRAAGLQLSLEVDPAQLARMKAIVEKKLMHPRQANQARAGHSSTLPSSKVLSRVLTPIGRIGGNRRWAGKSKKDRSDHMRMMVMAREKKRRLRKQRRAARAKRQGAAHREQNAQNATA